MVLDDPDALSMILRGLRLKAEVYLHGNFCGAWAVDTSGKKDVPFHLIGNGVAWLHMEGRKPQRLTSGDLVVFPHDHHHIIAATEERPDTVNAEPDEGAEADPVTNMICGFFHFESELHWPLLESLPEVIVLDLGMQSSHPHIQQLIQLIIAELNSHQQGCYAAVNTLAHILFIHILRFQLTQGLEIGLLAALADKKISKALNDIHQHPAETWTLERLAASAGMGRSAFADQFKQLVGQTPIKYLNAWRLLEAKHLLESSSRSIIDIAEACGYQSEVVFRKAYKKEMGETPGQTRKAALDIE